MPTATGYTLTATTTMPYTDAVERVRAELKEEGFGVLCEIDVQATLRAKLLQPPMAARVPEEERAAFLHDYRKMLVEMLADEVALEAKLLDGDLEAARELFKSVRAYEDEGHDRFTDDG